MKSIINPYRHFLNSKRVIMIIAIFLASNLFLSKVFAQQKPWVSPKEAQIVKNPLAGNTAPYWWMLKKSI